MSRCQRDRERDHIVARGAPRQQIEYAQHHKGAVDVATNRKVGGRPKAIGDHNENTRKNGEDGVSDGDVDEFLVLDRFDDHFADGVEVDPNRRGAEHQISESHPQRGPPHIIRHQQA